MTDILVRPYTPRPPRTDAQLEAKLQDFRRYATAVVNQLWHGPAEDRPDIVQEIMVSIMERRPEWEPLRGPALLVKIRRICLTTIQRLKRESVKEVKTIELLKESATEEQPRRLRMTREEFKAHYQVRIDALPDKYRLPLNYALQGYEHVEIAQLVGVSHRNSTRAKTIISARLDYALREIGAKPSDLRAKEQIDVDIVDCALFEFCSDVTVYHAPKQPWLPWTQQHPGALVIGGRAAGRQRKR